MFIIPTVLRRVGVSRLGIQKLWRHRKYCWIFHWSQYLRNNFLSLYYIYMGNVHLKDWKTKNYRDNFFFYLIFICLCWKWTKVFAYSVIFIVNTIILRNFGSLQQAFQVLSRRITKSLVQFKMTNYSDYNRNGKDDCNKNGMTDDCISLSHISKQKTFYQKEQHWHLKLQCYSSYSCTHSTHIQGGEKLLFQFRRLVFKG